MISVRLLLVASLFALVAPQAAHAQMAPAPMNWAGPYAGIHVGAIWGSFGGQSATTAGASGSASDVLGGVQAGYNWQQDRIVYGGEADFSPTSLTGSGANANLKENWTSTLRARAGYTFGNCLPYATLGLGLTNADSNAGGGSINNTHIGVAIGGGADYALYNNLSFRVEYLYVDVPEESDTINGTHFTGGASNNIFRIGANYHFR